MDFSGLTKDVTAQDDSVINKGFNYGTHEFNHFIQKYKLAYYMLKFIFKKV